MQANYYVVLGILPEASASQIKRAYRQRGQECQPDHDPEGARRFEEVKAAYQTLINPTERARYDQELLAQPPVHTPRRHVDILRDFETHKPSLQEIVDTFARNFHHRGEPKSVRPRGLTIEMVLSREEAMRGTRLALAVPVFKPCKLCEGTGRTGTTVCDQCGGAGNEQHEARVDVIVPRNTIDGAVIPVSLRQFGVRNLYLQVRLRVSS